MTQNSPQAPHIQSVIAARLSRRDMIRGAAALPLLSLTTAEAGAQAALPARALTFQSVPATIADAVTVPPGYCAHPLIAWGDALFESAAAFDPDALTRPDQELRFGQNNDMLALFPARADAAPDLAADEFLLCANHEYVDPALMYPGLTSRAGFTAAHGQALYAAVGVSVVKIAREADGRWRVHKDSAPGAGRNRRVTAFTPAVFEGPAARHRWIEAAGGRVNEMEPGAPEGAIACGTLGNCGGGKTPWGTYLSAEENFQSFFTVSDANAPALTAAQADPAWVLDAANFGFPLFDGFRNPIAPPQFDVSRNPHGPSLYGWIVEIDPYDPTRAPRKRTALGRRKAECANGARARDGRVVVYMGDDQINEYVYKFVSSGRFNPTNRLANRDLLNDGALYVARFEEDGRGVWIELTVSAANRAARAARYTALFADEGDLLMRTREAARLLGATPMDRPEDVEALCDAEGVGLGPVFVVCTNSRDQGFERPGNPRRDSAAGPARAQANLAGHILRIDEARGDCGATRFRWDVFVLAGDPNATGPTARTPAGTEAYVSVSRHGAPTIAGDRIACADNLCFDAGINVWIATDGAPAVFGDCNDAVLATPSQGLAPRPMKRFLVGPVGSEICGPLFSPDNRTFFAAIQHPGESDAAGADFGSTRWANPGMRPPSTFPDGGWPRAAVVYVIKEDGGIIGG